MKKVFLYYVLNAQKFVVNMLQRITLVTIVHLGQSGREHFQEIRDILILTTNSCFDNEDDFIKPNCVRKY